MYGASSPKGQQSKVLQMLVTTVVVLVLAGYAIYASGVNVAVRTLKEELFPKKADPELARSHYKAAVELLDHYPDISVAEFTEAITADPGFTDAYFQRGILMMGFKGEQAIADFNKVLELSNNDPAYAEVYFFRGGIYQSLGKLEECAADLTSYLNAPTGERAPNPVFDSARRKSTDALFFTSHEWQAYMGRGQSYFLLDRTEEALNDFDKALEMDRDNTLMALKQFSPRLKPRLEVLPEGEIKTRLKNFIEQAEQKPEV